MRILAATLLISNVLISAPVNATIIYDNGLPDDEWDVTGWASDLRLQNTIGDNFFINKGEIIDGVHWWGGYAGVNESACCEDDYTIKIYKMNEGVPDGMPLLTQNIGNVGRKITRSLPISGGVSEYEYYAQLDAINLDAGNYLLSIVNNTPIDDYWFWYTTSLEGSSWRRPGVDESASWSRLNYEFAFNLSGYVDQVPVPGPFFLFSIGVLGWIIYSESRKDVLRQ